jgi:hypothetical protein
MPNRINNLKRKTDVVLKSFDINAFEVKKHAEYHYSLIHPTKGRFEYWPSKSRINQIQKWKKGKSFLMDIDEFIDENIVAMNDSIRQIDANYNSNQKIPMPIFISFYYGIPKNKLEKKVYRLLSDTNYKQNKLIPNPNIHILFKRYRDVLKSVIDPKGEIKYATKLILVKNKSSLALIRKFIKTGKEEEFCTVSISEPADYSKSVRF